MNALEAEGQSPTVFPVP